MNQQPEIQEETKQEQIAEETVVILVDVYGFPITQEQAQKEPFMAEVWF